MVTSRCRGRLIRWSAVAVALLLAWFFPAITLAAETSTNEPESVFERIYTKSMANMAAPDQTFTEIIENELGETPVLYAATSKTCSKRCSTRCSKSCTTTRGCSTRCKVQTDGCGGTVGSSGSVSSSVTPTPTASQVASVASAQSMPRSAETKYNLRDVQYLLLVAGYDLYPSGEMDSKTQEAIADFQERNGLSATGVADDNLWRTLCAAVSALGGGSFSSPQSGTTGQYWINSSSNTRHNSSCRWFGTTKQGYYTNEKVGKACGTCGG